MGMNARNFKVISKLNSRKLYPLVDDKVQTKILANQHGINTPGLIGVIEHQHQVKDILNIVKDYKEFVIKPAHGSGGRGVLVVRSYSADCFTTASGKTLTYKELYQYISNILSGLYSLGGQYDVAVIEELVHFSNIFQNYSFQGIPDVRVIVYKGYPAMSMMRLATKASGGRANLHQGAVGVGLDIHTGHTLHAVMNNLPIEKAHDKIITAIRAFFKKACADKAVLGLSGGIDSAVVMALAVEALGNKNVRTNRGARGRDEHIYHTA